MAATLARLRSNTDLLAARIKRRQPQEDNVAHKNAIAH